MRDRAGGGQKACGKKPTSRGKKKNERFILKENGGACRASLSKGTRVVKRGSNRTRKHGFGRQGKKLGRTDSEKEIKYWLRRRTHLGQG